MGKILALPYYSHRGLCASVGGLRRARSVCVSLSAFSFVRSTVVRVIDASKDASLIGEFVVTLSDSCVQFPLQTVSRKK